MKKVQRRVTTVLGGAAIVAASMLGTSAVANAGWFRIDWWGTTDGNTRVHGQVDQWGGGSVQLYGDCNASIYNIYTARVSNVTNYYLKTGSTCWWGVDSYGALPIG